MNRRIKPWLTCMIVVALCAVDGFWANGDVPKPEKTSSSADDRQITGHYPALQNLLRIHSKLYSGGVPSGEKAFEQLRRLGIQTIVSVDGARPRIETARQFGMQYVHVPIGYDGVDPLAGLSLARIARDVEGPVYVHCHHGLHRGPAAAAIISMAAGRADGAKASEILNQAGTSKDYVGLWRDVLNYQTPDKDVKLPELVEFSKVDSVASVMAKIDRAMENLEKSLGPGGSMPGGSMPGGSMYRDRANVIPAEEALKIKEWLRETARHYRDQQGDDFKLALTKTESLVQTMENMLRANHEAGRVSDQLVRIKESCKGCHETFRN